MYSTNNKIAQEVCKVMGYSLEAGFIKAMQRNGTVYVSATLGKASEWKQLKRDCEQAGYIYKGLEIY